MWPFEVPEDVPESSDFGMIIDVSGDTVSSDFGIIIDRTGTTFSDSPYGGVVDVIDSADNVLLIYYLIPTDATGDPDGDGVCTASDNCPTWSNVGQGRVLFGQTALAASNKVDFGWPTPVEWQLATGTFTASADIGTYVVDFFAQGSGTVYSDAGFPPTGFGYWYVWRPDCPAGSYSTGTASQQGDRDGALLP